MAKITVAITTHNLENYIETCLQELARQTFQDFEILIYDDCSTDRTREILSAIKHSSSEKITLLLGQASLGSPARSRNAVLESGAIHGEYIVFLDGDDDIEPAFLEKLYHTAERTGADLALCAYDRFEAETGHVLSQEMRGFPQEIPFPPADDILAFINGSLWNKLIRVSCLEGLRIPDFKVGEDISFQLAVFSRCTKIACVDEILIHYRVRAGSVISSIQEETIHQFSAELERLWANASLDWMRHTLELAAFIHIGISMPMRAYGSPQIDLKALLHRITAHFADGYQWFRGNPFFHLSSLRKHGIRGLGIWSVLLCYRLHCVPLFLFTYHWLTRTFRFEIKF